MLAQNIARGLELTGRGARSVVAAGYIELGGSSQSYRVTFDGRTALRGAKLRGAASSSRWLGAGGSSSGHEGGALDFLLGRLKAVRRDLVAQLAADAEREPERCIPDQLCVLC
jgi:hypothetical protein